MYRTSPHEHDDVADHTPTRKTGAVTSGSPIAGESEPGTAQTKQMCRQWCVGDVFTSALVVPMQANGSRPPRLPDPRRKASLTTSVERLRLLRHLLSRCPDDVPMAERNDVPVSGDQREVHASDD